MATAESIGIFEDTDKFSGLTIADKTWDETIEYFGDELTTETILPYIKNQSELFIVIKNHIELLERKYNSDAD